MFYGYGFRSLLGIQLDMVRTLVIGAGYVMVEVHAVLLEVLYVFTSAKNEIDRPATNQMGTTPLTNRIIEAEAERVV